MYLLYVVIDSQKYIDMDISNTILIFTKIIYFCVMLILLNRCNVRANNSRWVDCTNMTFSQNLSKKIQDRLNLRYAF